MAKARFGSAVMTSTDKEADEAWVSARFCLTTNKWAPARNARANSDPITAAHRGLSTAQQSLGLCDQFSAVHDTYE